MISVTTRSNVTIKGFKITGAATNYAGFSLTTGGACTIENNKFVDNFNGIEITGSPNCVVRNNTVDKTSGIGNGTGIIISGSSHYNTVSDNTVSNCGSGIYISGSDEISLLRNDVSLCSGSGIKLENADDGTLENNEAVSNGNIGIYLATSDRNDVIDNTVSSNFGNGIDLYFATENTVQENTVLGNTAPSSSNNHGIMLRNSTDNNVQSNTISDCEYGVAVSMSSSGNTVVSNTASENGRGLFVAYGASGNTLSKNTANLNSQSGIVLTLNSRNNVVDNNTANSNGYYGIALDTTNNNKISNNLASRNQIGINLEGSGATQNLITGNTLSSNSRGIESENAVDNDFVSNAVDSSVGYGIYLVGDSSRSTTLNSNIVRDNGDIGIYLMQSEGATVSKNEASEHTGKPGIMLSLTNNSTISKNRASENNWGISFNSSKGNTVSENRLNSNGIGMFFCAASSGNSIFNNYFSNPSNLDVKNNRCSWNTERDSGRNIMGGPYLGGNFWGDTAGRGFSEITPDTNGDGITETPYNAQYDEDHYNVVDNLPLVNFNDVDPVSDFITSTTYGLAPQAVQFTDRSENAGSYNWDFGDGASSTQQNPTHTYTEAGVYTVTLTVNGNGNTDSSTATITILEHAGTVLPVAKFTSNVTSGYAPLAVQFNDSSENANTVSWDFDNNGRADSPARNPVHVYSTAGNYTVKLTATNDDGTDSETAIISVRNFTIQPVADFTTNVASGYAPLAVQFTDRSQNATSWSWTFGDGASSTEQSPAHTYASAGTYTATLTAINVNGTSSKSATINVYSSGGGGGGSKSGGGGGGSPEPATNVQVKELSQTQVTNGNPVKFDFARNATCVMSITFDAKKTAGKTTGTVEMLKEKSTLVSTLPSGEIYRFFNIWIGNAGFSTPSNIANPVINFKVEKAWIQDKNIDKASITLNRYSDKKWEQIPVSLTGEDNNYLYFSAKTPGFSPFGITGKAKEASTQITPVPSNTQSNPGSEVPQKTATEQKTTTPASKPSPGFEIIYGIVGLFAIAAYKRK